MTIVGIGVRLHDHPVVAERVRREPLPRKAHTACGGERLVLQVDARSRRRSPPVTSGTVMRAVYFFLFAAGRSE